MRVLICGDRDWTDIGAVAAVFDQHIGLQDVVIEGGGRGVDSIAHRLAVMRYVGVVHIPAEWEKYGPGAGPRRNVLMLEKAKPNWVIAFHDALLTESRGTKHMVKIARKAGITVLHWTHATGMLTAL